MEILLYLPCFLYAAFSAALPAVVAVADLYDPARVSAIVTSHVRHLPRDQGISVTPSGRFPSARDRPAGSFDAGTFARVRARHMMSLIWACLVVRPALRLQDRPCVPRASTVPPQWHVCGAQMGAPSRKPTATLMASLSSRSPHDDIGRALSQSLLWGAVMARTLALSADSLDCAMRFSRSRVRRGLSQCDCLANPCAIGVSGPF